MYTYITSALFLLLLVAVPSESLYAQSLASFAGCSGPDCSTCNIVSIANGLIKWLIGFLFVLFAGLIAYAGFGLVTSGGNQGALDAAKEKFSNAIIGMLLILSAWLIVDTIMRGLVGQEGNEGQVRGSVSGWLMWSDVQCYTQVTPDDVDPFDVETFEPRFIETFEPAANAGDGSTVTYSGPPATQSRIGSGNTAIVNYASQMMKQGCQYSQEKRNGCAGSPGYTDCSNLVEISYRAAGCNSPGGTTATQYPRAENIGNQSSLRAGDALVYRNGNKGHVVICMNNGCGTVIHAKGKKYGIVVGSGSNYLRIPNIRVIRASSYCPNTTSGA